MTTVIVLIRDVTEEFQLEVVVFSRKEENEMTVTCQFIYIIKDSVRAHERIDTSNTTYKGV